MVEVDPPEDDELWDEDDSMDMDDLDDVIDDVEDEDIVDGEFGDVMAMDTSMNEELVRDFENLLSGSVDKENKEVDISSSYLDDIEVEVRYDLIDSVMESIYTEISNWGGAGTPPVLIIGTPQFAVVEPWCQEEYGHHISAELPVDNVFVVPGPQIHAPYLPEELLAEYLGDDDDTE